MKDIHALINEFASNQISLETLQQTLEKAIAEGELISNILKQIKQSPTLSTDQINSLTQYLQQYDNDKTVVLNTNNASDDKTVILHTPVDNDDEKTIVAPARAEDNDATVIDDKTRIQAHPSSQQPSPDTEATRIADHQLTQQQSRHPPKLEPGAIINNRFVLEKLLGRGGMGSVFKARDLRKEEANDPNSHIAIKFLNEDFKQHPQALISLQRESKKSQTLAHPNIITVHDFDRDGDIVYMTMEYLDGAPLDEYLHAHKNTGVKKEAAIKIIEDVSHALSYAHKKNIVHSDFKPGNVFVTKDGTAKVLDFGIARAVKNISDKSSESATEKTMFDAGDLGGLTPTYASCEMLEGKQPSPSDDMYALGCVAYELLTGAHPFNRMPATKARDAGLKPEPIKQLDKKQANALLHTLQFSMQDRTKDAQTFINEFFIRKHTSKGLMITLAFLAIVLIAVGVKYFIDYQQQIATEELVSQIKQGDSSVIAAAIPELMALEGETRETVLSDVRPMVVRYYSAKALPLADQSNGKYDYPGAMAILAEAKILYPDSAQLNELIIQLKNNQSHLISTLAAQIDKYLQKGNLTSAVYNNDIQDIIDLLKIAAPESHLLKDQRIKLAYVREIKTALKNDQLKDAKVLIKSAITLFSSDDELIALKENIKNREAQKLEDQQLRELQEQLSNEGKQISNEVRKKALKRHSEKLVILVKQGFKDDDWVNKVQSEVVAIDVFAKTKSEKQLKLRNKAATLVIQKARKLRRTGELGEARILLKQADKISPKLSALIKEKRALAVAERKQLQALGSREKAAKITALREKLLIQAKQDDVKNAVKTLSSLKKLDSKSRFVKTEGPEAIADAYLRLAAGLAKRNNFKSALELASAGSKIAPRYIPAKTTKKQYQAEIAVLQLNQALDNFEKVNIKQTQRLLGTIKSGLPGRYASIVNDAAQQTLEQIQNLAKSNKEQAKILADVARQIFPDNEKIARLTRRSSKFQSEGGQPCKASYAGHGKRTRATCFDMINNTTRAPLMVVIPASTKNSSIYAISKYEISIAEYNIFCRDSGKCKPRNRIDIELPITNISVSQMTKYLTWLSQKTGKAYQLPTDAQWRHAAIAKGKFNKQDVNCRLMLGSKQIKGIDLLNVQSGKQNAWGLKNVVGNAQELVTQGKKYYARGGAYTDSFSQCDIDLKRRHSGKKDKVTGFRIVKVL